MLWLESVVYVPVIVESTVSDLELQRPGFLIACYREIGGRLIEVHVPFLFLSLVLAVDLTLYRPEVEKSLSTVLLCGCSRFVTYATTINEIRSTFGEMLLHGCFFVIFFLVFIILFHICLT